MSGHTGSTALEWKDSQYSVCGCVLSHCVYVLVLGAAKYEAEKAAEDAAKKEAKNKERTTKKLEGGWRNLAEVSHVADKSTTDCSHYK